MSISKVLHQQYLIESLYTVRGWRRALLTLLLSPHLIQVPTTSSRLSFARTALFLTDGLVVSEHSAMVKALADWWAGWML